MKKSLILCALLGIIISGILVSPASAHNVLSREPCPSQRFPNEICFFHVVKNGEITSRILARYSSSEITLSLEDLSKVPENLYILKRERPLRFKNAWDYLLPEDVIVFPFLYQATLWEARLEELTHQLSWLETTFISFDEQLRDLKERIYNLRLGSFLFFAMGIAAFLVFGLIFGMVIAAIWTRRTIASKTQTRNGA